MVRSSDQTRDLVALAPRRGNKMMRISQFLHDEEGATAIEYGLIASLISIAAIAAFNNVGSKLKSTFNDVANNLAS